MELGENKNLQKILDLLDFIHFSYGGYSYSLVFNLSRWMGPSLACNFGTLCFRTRYLCEGIAMIIWKF